MKNIIAVTLLLLSTEIWADNDDINGWGDFTWGMTVEEVKKIDPKWDSETVKNHPNDKHIALKKSLMLFGYEFELALGFNDIANKGIILHTVRLHYKSDNFNKNLVLHVYGALLKKYGQDQAPKLNDTSHMNGWHAYKPELGVDFYQGEMYTDNRVWNFKKTQIRFIGNAKEMSTDHGVETNPPYTKLWIMYLSQVWGKSDSESDSDKL